jgi:hypothetical protein
VAGFFIGGKAARSAFKTAKAAKGTAIRCSRRSPPFALTSAGAMAGSLMQLSGCAADSVEETGIIATLSGSLFTEPHGEH